MEIFKKYLYYATIGLFVYMPFHIFLSQWLSTYTGGLNGWKIAKDVFTSILVSVIVCTVLLTRRYTRLFLYLIGIAVLFLLLHMALLFITNQPHDTGLLATVYNNRLIWYVLIGYGLSLLMPKAPLISTFTRTLILISTVVCLFGLLQWVLPKDVMTHFGYAIDRGVKPNFFIDDKTDLPRVFSTLRDPNSLGAFLILPIVLLVDSLLRYWKTSRRMFLSGLLILHVLVLWLTFSRSAFLGAILSMVALFILRNRKFIRENSKRLLLPAVVLILVVAGGVFVLRDQYVVQNVVFHSDENTKMTDSNNLHLILIKRGVDGIADHPLGSGPGTAGLVSTHSSNNVFITENYFVQIGYEVGIEGLILFVGFLTIVLIQLWKKKDLPISRALLASFMGLVFMNMLLHTWANEAVAAEWFILSGLAIGHENLTTKKRKASE